MSGDLTARDDLVQQLADEMEPWALADRTMLLDAARAVLASGLVVPTSDVLNLAQQHARRGPQLTDGVTVAAELRALTQQETR